MRTTIDRAGRLVIPRALRSQVGLLEGGEVNVAVEGASIRIEPVSGVELQEREGLLLIPPTGTAMDGASIRQMVDADRASRG
jgi:AbrB family looped-hinge helix DNA binding protein